MIPLLITLLVTNLVAWGVTAFAISCSNRAHDRAESASVDAAEYQDKRLAAETNRIIAEGLQQTALAELAEERRQHQNLLKRRSRRVNGKAETPVQ